MTIRNINHFLSPQILFSCMPQVPHLQTFSDSIEQVLNTFQEDLHILPLHPLPHL